MLYQPNSFTSNFPVVKVKQKERHIFCQLFCHFFKWKDWGKKASSFFETIHMKNCIFQPFSLRLLFFYDSLLSFLPLSRFAWFSSIFLCVFFNYSPFTLCRVTVAIDFFGLEQAKIVGHKKVRALKNRKKKNLLPSTILRDWKTHLA